MRYVIVDNATQAWVGDVFVADEAPAAAEGQSVRIVPDDYPTGCYWVIAGPAGALMGGFREVVDPTTMLMSVGRFKLDMLTKSERIAIRAAGKVNPEIEDFLDVLNGFTEGVALNDPALAEGITALVPAGLLTQARADQILSGQPPASTGE